MPFIRITFRRYHKRDDNDQLWSPTKIIPASLDKLTVKERESVLRYLLSKLHAYDKQRASKQTTETTDALGIVVNIPKSAPSSDHVQQQQRSHPQAATIEGLLPPIHAKKEDYKDRLKSFRKNLHVY